MEKRKRSFIFTGLILAAVVIVFVVMNLVGVKGEIAADTVEISAPFFKESVPFSQIADLQLRDSIPFGTRSFGGDFVGVKLGTFRNDEFGTYRCAVHTGTARIIVLKKSDGAYVVFNCKTPEQTEQLFADLLKKLPR